MNACLIYSAVGQVLAQPWVQVPALHTVDVVVRACRVVVKA